MLFSLQVFRNFCENFFLKTNFSVNFTVVRDYTFYEFSYLTLVETCFIAQNTVDVDNVPCSFEKDIYSTVVEWNVL